MSHSQSQSRFRGITVANKRVRSGYYSQAHPYRFVATEDFSFGGRRVPKGSACKFFETTNFGFVVWREPNDTNPPHIARE